MMNLSALKTRQHHGGRQKVFPQLAYVVNYLAYFVNHVIVLKRCIETGG